MKRKEVYEKIGHEDGWHHIFAGGLNTIMPIGPFQLLYEGAYGYVSQGMKKNESLCVEILFDLEFQSNNELICTTCYYISDSSIDTPIFYMEPKSSFDFLSKWIDKNVIYYTEFPSFNKFYKLVSPQKNFKKHPMNNQVLTYFSFEKDWYLEGNGHQLLIYKHGKYIENDLLRPFLQVCQTIAAMFKGEEVL